MCSSSLADNQAVLILAILAVSLAVCVYIQTNDRQLAFFLPFTRAWELLSGSLLALVEQRFGRAKPSVYADRLAALGVLLLAGAIIMFRHTTAHPGILTAIPVLGTGLIIAFARSEHGVGAALSARPLVAIGLISYSLYLWHYPILAFLRIIDGGASNLDKLLAIMLVGLLSVMTYYVIERPFRYEFSNRWLVASTASIAAGMIAISGWVIASGGLPQRLQAVYSAEARKIEDALLSEYENFRGDINGHKPILLVIGDSHLRNWSVALGKYFDTDRYDIVNISYLQCEVKISADRVEAELLEARYEQGCQALVRFLNDQRVTSRVKAIFLVSYRPFEYASNIFRFDLVNWISFHSKTDVEKFVFGNYYQLDENRINSCLNFMYRTKRDASVCLEKNQLPC